MSRRRGGRFNEENSRALSVRVENELAAAVEEAARNAGAANVNEWLRALLRQAVGGTSLGTARHGSGVLVEHSDGWRAGWAAANAQFRRALKATLADPPPESA